MITIYWNIFEEGKVVIHLLSSLDDLVVDQLPTQGCCVGILNSHGVLLAAAQRHKDNILRVAARRARPPCSRQNTACSDSRGGSPAVATAACPWTGECRCCKPHASAKFMCSTVTCRYTYSTRSRARRQHSRARGGGIAIPDSDD